MDKNKEFILNRTGYWNIVDKTSGIKTINLSPPSLAKILSDLPYGTKLKVELPESDNNS